MTNYRIYEDFDGVKEEVITKEEEIEEFMNLPYDEQLRVYFQKGSRPMKRIVRYENSEKYLSLESVVGEVEFTGTKFFVKHSIGNKFLYKKENKKTFSRYDRDMLLRDLILFPRFDWIKNEYEKKHIMVKFLVIQSCGIFSQENLLMWRLLSKHILKRFISKILTGRSM